MDNIFKILNNKFLIKTNNIPTLYKIIIILKPYQYTSNKYLNTKIFKINPKLYIPKYHNKTIYRNNFYQI